MQPKSDYFGEFSSRTDRLAAHLRVNVSELTDVIHLSNGMLFAYRKGKHPISAKAWSKLEAAEVAAGLKPDRQAEVRQQKQSLDGLPEESRAMVTGPHLAWGHYLSIESLFDAALKTRQPLPDPQEEADFKEHLRMFMRQRERGREAMIRMRDVAEDVGHLLLKNAAARSVPPMVTEQGRADLAALEKSLDAAKDEAEAKPARRRA